MLSSMRIEFLKMQGLGNDFFVFDAPAAGAAFDVEQAARARRPAYRRRLRSSVDAGDST